ncbi:LysR family transcriptional regulator [Frondihabitans australicus]|uniref:DNA-binding transcriptional LysR family regulator n=1 Tax=Frondihabitans australicus TaxID=386892 RepID=A0A495IG99_9MICO|nr:LysR family transcriptional regulator [Frondihabitans australicus]RKR75042.1 DNA-binding transcriptional LysR family regulator [Frondihabitans australicus]
MDLLAAYRVAAAVGERHSVTAGAASLGVPQSVASRRIAALESHLGLALFDRGGRELMPTVDGRALLPAIARLVRLADDIEIDAERAGSSTSTIVVPDVASLRDLAVLEASCREAGLPAEIRTAGPRERAELVRDGVARLAVVAMPAAGSRWRVRLGLAGRRERDSAQVTLSSMRRRRGATRGPRILLLPEDDVPHVRDELQRAASSLGLSPAQVVRAGSRAGAVAEALRGDDVVLCSADEADEAGLSWRPVRDAALSRGYAVAAAERSDRDLAERIHDAIAEFLGAEKPDGEAW